MTGSVFMPTSTSPATAEADPRKHVNYVLGMVLGVDDFNQEFGYLAGRDQLAAREIAGYGVVRGLRVSTLAAGPKGPEIVVSAGTAITPEGRFVKVPLSQCVTLNDWIARNKSKLPAPSPGSPKTVMLSIVLSYAEQVSDLVPIPGEPCRTEEESMAASRVTDDFLLELRVTPPEQREQDAIGQYLRWLGEKVQPVDAGGLPLADFLAQIATAAFNAPKVTPPSGATPATPLPFGARIFEPAGFSAKVPRNALSQYLKEAIRLFTTLRAEWIGFGATADSAPPKDDALLLAQAKFIIEVDALDASVWKVQSSTPIAFDEARRSRLLPLAFLQELTLALVDRTQQSVTLASAGARYLVVAAGTVTIKAVADATAQPQATYNGLNAVATADGVVTVSFNNPADPALQYVVKVLPMAEPALPTFINPDVSLLAAPVPGAGATLSFTLRVVNTTAATPSVCAPVTQANLTGRKLMIEVTAFG